MNITEQFIELVKINSPSRREGAMATYLKARLAQLGAQVTEDQSAAMTGSDTGNLLAVYPGNADKATVLLAAHMDTVGDTEGMTPQIRDGSIYSEGKTILGADDKAGIAIMLQLLERLRDNGDISHGPIELLFTVQEEVGLRGVKNLQLPLQAQFGYALDGDGPAGHIVNASPSHNTLDITIAGKAAHAGVAPEEGINAILIAARAIAAIPSGRLDQETTCNFGTIQGGKARNVVADQVYIQAEVRSHNKEKLNKHTQLIVDTFQQVTQEHGGSLQIIQEQAYQGFTVQPLEPAIAYAVAAGQKLGLEVVIKATGGGLDANILNARGIPCVALGLGGYHAHTNEESVQISEMELNVQLLLGLLQEIPNH